MSAKKGLCVIYPSKVGEYSPGQVPSPRPQRKDMHPHPSTKEGSPGQEPQCLARRSRSRSLGVQGPLAGWQRPPGNSGGERMLPGGSGGPWVLGREDLGAGPGLRTPKENRGGGRDPKPGHRGWAGQDWTGCLGQHVSVMSGNFGLCVGLCQLCPSLLFHAFLLNSAKGRPQNATRQN